MEKPKYQRKTFIVFCSHCQKEMETMIPYKLYCNKCSKELQRLRNQLYAAKVKWYILEERRLENEIKQFIKKSGI